VSATQTGFPLALEDMDMAKHHGQRFVQLVDSVRAQIRECTIEEMIRRRDSGDVFLLIDVREESEFAAGRIPGARHLGKGIIERDIEEAVPDVAAPLVLYCGGGYRSALAALNLQQMGYTNVISMDGGFRGWKDSGQPIDFGAPGHSAGD
jgi:rhodanese-related sulfurtransferase